MLNDLISYKTHVFAGEIDAAPQMWLDQPKGKQFDMISLYGINMSTTLTSFVLIATVLAD